MKRVVIVGGGYGGITVAKELLEGELPPSTEIMLVDRMPFQGLKTEYFALAAGTAAELDVRMSFPDDPRCALQYGEVTELDLEERQIKLLDNRTGVVSVDYELLVIALGCTDRFHGIEGAEIYANSIQTLTAARKTYQQINNVSPYGQISIVGGGLSGVELAAELRESRPDLNIRIIDHGPSLLSSFAPKLQSFVRDWFEEHDVELRSNTKILKVEPNLLLTPADPLRTDVTVWTAGIQPNSLVQQLRLPKDQSGRLLLNHYYQLPEYPQVYVVGDCASLPFAPSAQVAEEQGKQVAAVIQSCWKGEQPRLEPIRLKGVLGSLGKKTGFGMLGKRPMVGKVPRLLKTGVLWLSKRHLG